MSARSLVVLACTFVGCAPYQRARADAAWRESVLPWFAANARELVGGAIVLALLLGTWLVHRHRSVS